MKIFKRFKGYYINCVSLVCLLTLVIFLCASGWFIYFLLFGMWEEPVPTKQTVEMYYKIEPTEEPTIRPTITPTIEPTEEPKQEPVLNTNVSEDVQISNLQHECYYIEEIPLEHDLQDYIAIRCKEESISRFLVLAIIEKESDYRASVIGDKGHSYGLMQIKKKWHLGRMDKLGVSDLLNPYENVDVGIDYLLELFKQYEDIEFVIHAYNGGVSYAKRLSDKGKTSSYCTKIMERIEELERSCE